MEIVKKIKFKKEPGFIYFLDDGTDRDSSDVIYEPGTLLDLYRSPEDISGIPEDQDIPIEKVLALRLAPENGYLYVLDKDGNISRSKVKSL